MKDLADHQGAIDLLKKIYDNLSECHDCYGFYYGNVGDEIHKELMQIFDPEEYEEMLAEQDE